MANYSLILDTKFKPFSYAEMLAPVAAATQAHQAIEEEYGNLATKANVWEEMANEQTDPYAYKMYKTYSDDLEARAEQLMRYGLNASSRKGMLDMRARYSKEIVPIETAYKRREELATEQRKALAQNPTMLYQRMASTMSLDDFIKNPSLDYGQQYSGALITQQVASAAANIAKEARDSEEGKRRLRKILPYQYELVQQSGFSREAVMKAILNSPDADKILTGLVEDAISSSGVKEWGDAATQKRAYDYARQGLYSAIGQTQYQMVTDQAGLTRLQYDLQDRNNKRAEARAAARKAQEAAAAAQQEANAIKLSGISYLQASGDLGRYQRALSAFKGGQQGIKAAYFGKHGTVNPMTVYSAANAAMSNAERRIRQTYEPQIRRATDDSYYEPGYGAGKHKADRLKREMSFAITAARTKAYQDTLKKYGVTKGITKDQYDALQAIGYNGKTPMLNYSQLTDPLNALAQQRSYYSTNMSGYDIPDQKIRSQLGNWEANGTFSTAVYKLNANGTQGEAVSYGDLKLANGTDNPTRKVTGIYYSAFTPGKIIVQIGETGDRYLMDPNVLGTEVATLIGQTQSIINSDPNVDLTEASVATTTALSRLLNSYNPTAPKSSKEAE